MMEFATTYRSKDTDFMTNLKQSVIKGMRGHTKEEKKAAWDYMRRRVFMDDMHKYAIEQLDTEEPVQMGIGDLRSQLLVITMRPLTYSKEGREFTEKIVEAGKFKHVYYTARFKTPTIYKSKKPVFDEILRSEVKILKPKAILCFGEVFPEYGLHEVKEHEGFPIIQTNLISSLLGETEQENVKKIKNQIWSDVKQIRKNYKK